MFYEFLICCAPVRLFTTFENLSLSCIIRRRLAGNGSMAFTFRINVMHFFTGMIFAVLYRKSTEKGSQPA